MDGTFGNLRIYTGGSTATAGTSDEMPALGSNGYGLGLILYPDGSFGHTGTLEQTHAMVVSRPDGVTWAVLVNGEYPSESSRIRGVVDRALDAAFTGTAPP